MDNNWVRTFRNRIMKFQQNQSDGLPLSIKVRVSSGCFHREHSPQAYRIIDDFLQRTPDKNDYAFEEHESGPEILVAIAATSAVLTLAKSVIDLITTFIKARSEGIRKGDRPSEALELIVRRIDSRDEYSQEISLRIEHSSPVSRQLIEDAIGASIRKLIPVEQGIEFERKPIRVRIFFPFAGVEFRKEATKQTETRIEILNSLASDMGPNDLQVYPAGWLCASSEKRAMELIEKAVNSIQRLRVHPTIVFGVDGWLEGKKKLIPSQSGYPFWICVIRSDGERHLFQQIAISASEVIPESRWSSRLFTLPGKKCSTIACGEILTEYVRRKTADTKPEIVLLLAHQGIKLGNNQRRCWNYRIENLRKDTNAIVLVSEHTRNPERHSKYSRRWGSNYEQGDWLPNMRTPELYQYDFNID